MLCGCGPVWLCDVVGCEVMRCDAMCLCDVVNWEMMSIRMRGGILEITIRLPKAHGTVA